MRRLLRTTTASLALCAIAAAAHAASGSFPLMNLPEASATGQRAIDLLGSQLDAVAAHYQRSPAELRAMLLNDPLLRIDRHGRLYFVDTLDRQLPPTSDNVTPEETATPAPLGDTFRLHSRKGAKRTIYLDFNGAVLEDTAWNGGGGPLTAKPFDLDGNVDTNFTAQELERIQFIWLRVAEDFAPFDIDVTTEEPKGGKLTRKDANDDVYGTTALITSTEDFYDCNCGGVAYVGVFDAIGDFNKPALVFYNKLGAGNEKYVTEATSHEVGHNLGLNHDGYSGGSYYPGHGEGVTGWAPIMGVGYYQNLVQWSKGEYNTANNHEDDFVVMGNNGGPLRADDHGNSADSATELTVTYAGTNNNLDGSGVIERARDKDYFSFVANAGPAEFIVAGDRRTTNLDASLVILDAAGTTIAKSQPKEALGASVSFTVPSAGTYYLVVDGVGKGKVLETGYSDYGSLGQYTVLGTVVKPE